MCNQVLDNIDVSISGATVDQQKIVDAKLIKHEPPHVIESMGGL